MKNYQTIKVLFEDDCATVMLQRPDKKNAMSIEMMEELITVAKWLKYQKSLRAVVLCGADGVFCSVLILMPLINHKKRGFIFWELIKPKTNFFQNVCLIWQSIPVPVIAVLEGYCYGAGMQLALGADIRIAHPQCQLSIMEAKWGLVPDMGLTKSVRGLMPIDRLKNLIFGADILDAKSSQEQGLVTFVNENPYELAKTKIAQWKRYSPDALSASKHLLNSMVKHSVFCTLYMERILQLRLLLGKNIQIARNKVKHPDIPFKNRSL